LPGHAKLKIKRRKARKSKRRKFWAAYDQCWQNE
jgi:hypothetical protein